MQELEKHVKELLNTRIAAIEKHFNGDCIFYDGPIFPSLEKRFREFIELLQDNGGNHKRLIVFLNSPGGSAETVEKMVEIIRYHYSEVYFVVPDEAMSAGTILCMSGDKIYMDYSSSLGPIDPQVFNGKDWVPALGYLDQVEKMIEKSANNELTEAELIILQNQDIAMLSQFEQAKNLTITILKEWLVEYKFKDWTTHQTNPEKLGQNVTLEEKEERAEEIANILSNNKIWHSHGRKISAATLSKKLKLKIEDYSDDSELRFKIRSYNDFLIDYINRHDTRVFLHSRCYFWGSR
jgi:hypothetical protein